MEGKVVLVTGANSGIGKWTALGLAQRGATVILGARSYREGRVFHFDDETMSIHDGDSSWATAWEQRSRDRGKPNHIAGWSAGDHGSVLEEPEYMKLAGPWKNGKPPEEG